MGIIRNFRHYKRRRRRIRQLNEIYPKLEIKSLDNIERKAIDFLYSTAPLVSVIIPFYNQFNYTLNCLYHLHTHLTDDIKYEIILIDDNSSENCDFSFIKGIRVITNNENAGFLKSINIGIREAAGEYIYILNNDTEVQKGFLSELLYVFDNFPNTGAVGSMLLNADGTLQEAGSVFLKDCDIHQVVRKKKVFYPQVNFIYKTDYCSGCSLLFKRKKDTGELNLFDEQFAPAYFEETDFCFQLKHLQNKDVYYTPFSRVLHYNGVTYNSSTGNTADKTTQKEELFRVNLGKFKNKWQKEIDAIRAPAVDARIEELYGNKSVVIFCGVIPQHDRDSGSNRLKEMIVAFLGLGYYVLMLKKKTYIYDGPYIEYYQRLGVNVFYEHNQDIKPGRYLENIISKPAIAWFYNPDVFLEYYPLAEKHLPKAKMVFDMVDIHHLRYKRASELEPLNPLYKKEYTKYLKMEDDAAKTSDHVITISDFEEKYMAQFCPPEKIITISNIHYPKIEIENTSGFEERKDIIFIGSSHTPNIDALYFLYNDIMPIVWQSLPGLKVNVIGNVKDRINDIDHPDFIFLGFVPDVEKLFTTNKLMVAPLRYGAGVKGKIGQAFEYHLPVVTTSAGAEGMQLTDGENALINDDKTGFANSIIELYSNKKLWLQLQANSEKSLEPFSKEKLKEQLLKIKHSL